MPHKKATPRYCLQCDDGTVLEFATRAAMGEMRGEPYRVEDITGWHGPVCGDIEFSTSDDADRVDAAVRAALTRANEHEAKQLRTKRKKLKLTQAEAGRLFGGGISAFSAYENGKTQPHRSTVLLLRLRGNHPELLDEVRQAG